MQNMKGEISRAQQRLPVDNPSRSCWIPAGNSLPYEAGLGFGAVPKAGRSEQQAEKKSKFMLEVLVQAGAHKSSRTKERLGVLLK